MSIRPAFVDQSHCAIIAPPGRMGLDLADSEPAPAATPDREGASHVAHVAI